MSPGYPKEYPVKDACTIAVNESAAVPIHVEPWSNRPWQERWVGQNPTLMHLLFWEANAFGWIPLSSLGVSTSGMVFSGILILLNTQN